MRIFDISKFSGDTLADIIDYLKEEYRNYSQNVMIALRSLSFTDNFRTFIWEGKISSGQTVTITNNFKTKPAYRIIVQLAPTSAGTVQIDDSLNPWTKDAVYLRNTGSVEANVKVVFFKN
jgi:hypothetical protein